MTRWLGRTFNCRTCGNEWPQTRDGQVFCTTCMPATPSEQRQTLVRLVGIERSQAMASFTRKDAVRPYLLWRAVFSVPFSAIAHSKNRSHILVQGTKRRIPSKQSSQAKAEIADHAGRAIATSGHRIVQSKVWIDIEVQKHAWQADAANVVDTVLDGIKLGIGLDDRWYSLHSVDWMLTKGEQSMVIGIGQETETDQDFCLACGSLVPLVTLVRYGGLARVCEGCKNEAERRERRA